MMGDVNVSDPTGPGVRVARSRGYAISYEEVGEGSPVVLVPGFMHSAAYWRQVGYVKPLAATRRVVTVDPLGHGQSDKPHEWEAYRRPDVAADVIAVLDASGLDRAALWGYSRGAWLACITAIEFPDRVAALILGGAPLTRAPAPESPWMDPPWMGPLLRGDWAAFWSSFPIPLSEEVKHYFEKFNDPRALGAAAKGARQSRYVIDLGRVFAPTLVYCGGEDDPGSVMATAQALGVELHVLEGRDHTAAFMDADGVMPLAAAHLEAADTL